ncbi:hypothetical protein T439DRAFT_246577 [Meredithblackwellia eburnea MCA 4105]
MSRHHFHAVESTTPTVKRTEFTGMTEFLEECVRGLVGSALVKLRSNPTSRYAPNQLYQVNLFATEATKDRPVEYTAKLDPLGGAGHDPNFRAKVVELGRPLVKELHKGHTYRVPENPFKWTELHVLWSHIDGRARDKGELACIMHTQMRSGVEPFIVLLDLPTAALSAIKSSRSVEVGGVPRRLRKNRTDRKVEFGHNSYHETRPQDLGSPRANDEECEEESEEE